MTVAATNSYSTGTGNGVATAFPFTFFAKTEAEVAVYLGGALQNSGYTVTLNSGGGGGTVTFSTAPASSVAVVIASDPLFTQSISFKNAGAFLPESQDDVADRAAARDIYLKDRVDRALLAPRGETLSELPSASERAGNALTFDSIGNPVASALTVTSAAGQSVSTRALLAAIANPVANQSAILTESGREGTFVFDSTNFVTKLGANLSTIDTAQGIYVAPASDTTGASGAWVRVIGDFVSSSWFGVVTGTANQAANFQKWADFISEYSYHGWVPAGTYTTGLVEFWHKTRVTFAPGCVINLAAGGSSIFRMGRWQPNTASVNYNVQPTDFNINGNGCKLNGLANSTSHVVQINGAWRAQFHDFIINGANGTTGKDCIYLGAGASFPGMVTTACQDVHLHHITAFGAGRNNISVVSCDGFIIENCDLSATTGTLVGACIDVEANTFSDVIRRGVIRYNRFHDNPRYGVDIAFGDDVEIYGNEFATQGLEAIVVADGGAATSASAARSGIEYRAITAPLDTAAGWIPLSNVDTLEIGTLVIPSVRGAGVLPPELTSTAYYFVVAKDAANSKVQLANNGVMYTYVSTFTNAGSGTLTADPMTSELYLKCVVEGHASNVKIHHNRFLGTSGGLAEVLCSLAVKVDISDNTFTCDTADRKAIYVRYSRKVTARNNRAVGYATGTTAVGLQVASSYDITYGGNEFKNFNGYGAYFSQVRELKELGRDTIVNCGKTNFPVRLEGCLRPQVRFKVANDVGYVTTVGISGDANTTYAVIDRCDVTNAGNSAGNAISFSSATTIMGRNTMRDGSIQSGLTGTSAGPAALANGTSTVTLGLTGAVANDRAWATLSAVTAGVSITAVYATAGNVNIVYSNTTGAAVNLSGVTVLFGAERVRVS